MIIKLIITLFLSCLFTIECQSQDTLKVADTTNQDIIIADETGITTFKEAEECKCSYLKTLAINVPKQLYEKDVNIMVWSYHPLYKYYLTPEKDTLVRLRWDVGELKNGKFYYGTIRDTITQGKENIKLSAKQKKQLFKLLHHYQVTESYCATDEVMCYQPRHVILFYKDNKVIDFLEICFECHKSVFSNKAFDEVFKCREKYDLLKVFFSKIGIKLYLDSNNIPHSEVRKRK